MTGEELKNILYKAHISQADVCRALGITTQALSAALQSKDVKSSLVERIASVCNMSIAEMYNECDLHINNTIHHNSIKNEGDNNIVATDNAQVETTANNDAVTKLLDEVSALRKQNQQLLDMLEKKI